MPRAPEPVQHKPVPETPAPSSKTALWSLAVVAALGGVALVVTLWSGGRLGHLEMLGMKIDFAAPGPAAPVKASRAFLVGKWEVEQVQGDQAGNTAITYNEDGTLHGWAYRFGGALGQREAWDGTWSFDKLSDTSFKLTAVINGHTVTAPFRIFDRDHIQNLDNNYIATRSP